MSDAALTVSDSQAEPTVPPLDAETMTPPLAVRTATFLTIVLPLIAAVVGPILLWGWGFHWMPLGLMLGMYVVTMLGITVGFHRLFVHRSFETYSWIKFIWAILGSMAVQGSLQQWVAFHRRHHQFSDTPDDPHSPLHGGKGVWGVLKGAWHAHIGWFFHTEPPELDRYAKDIRTSKSLMLASQLFPLWVALGLLIPTVIGGLITMTWMGALHGFIWGGLIRVCLVHHITWSINSACHMWGGRPFRSSDASRNNTIFGILAFGEGWHNAHHAFPTSARHGLKWWEIDMSYWTIWTLARLGLAWNLKLPSKELVQRETRVA